MSLRVLLADESSTIKKVMQLALQDFGVQVKSVPNGLDVSDVAKSFKPDIIFTDILLAKRNGYDVCAEFRRDPALSSIPFVLMWSGFMNLDEKKLALAEPSARLEKPFDAETLRELTQKLVPKLQSNVISQYLSFPDLPEIQESSKDRPPSQTAAPSEDFSSDEPEDFMQVPLPNPNSQRGPSNNGRPRSPLRDQIQETKEDWARPSSTKSTDEDWSQQSLRQFKLPVNDEDLAMAYERTGEDMPTPSMGFQDPGGSLAYNEPNSLSYGENSGDALGDDLAQQGPSPRLSASVSHERVEQIMREEIRKTLEGIAWKVLPDLAERIVREEIQKLLKDAERI